MLIRMIYLLLALTLLLMAGCQPVQMSGEMDEMAVEMEPEPGKITVMNARARPSPMAAGNGAAFLVVLNGLEEDVQFVSADSPASEAVELHETVNDDGVMRMIPQENGYAIPAGSSVELKPGGKHVMLINLVEQLTPGNEIELILNFDRADSITLSVPVMEIGEEMPMKMEGMEHGDDMDSEEMDEAMEHDNMDDDSTHNGEDDGDDSSGG